MAWVALGPRPRSNTRDKRDALATGIGQYRISLQEGISWIWYPRVAIDTTHGPPGKSRLYVSGGKIGKWICIIYYASLRCVRISSSSYYYEIIIDRLVVSTFQHTDAKWSSASVALCDSYADFWTIVFTIFSEKEKKRIMISRMSILSLNTLVQLSRVSQKAKDDVISLCIFNYLSVQRENKGELASKAFCSWRVLLKPTEHFSL